MKPFGTQISPHTSNPIQTRTDLSRFLTAIVDSLAPHTSPGGSRVHISPYGTHYDSTAAELEGFSRPIWGIAALVAGKGSYEGLQRWVNGLGNGTDAEGEEFWGDMRNKDQRMVECSAIGFALSVAKEALWDPLEERKKKGLERWLGGMNDKEMPNTNWLWFRVHLLSRLA
jgi:hypothetical protein